MAVQKCGWLAPRCLNLTVSALSLTLTVVDGRRQVTANLNEN